MRPSCGRVLPVAAREGLLRDGPMRRRTHGAVSRLVGTPKPLHQTAREMTKECAVPLRSAPGVEPAQLCSATAQVPHTPLISTTAFSGRNPRSSAIWDSSVSSPLDSTSSTWPHEEQSRNWLL